MRTTALVCVRTLAIAAPCGRERTARFVSCTGLHACAFAAWLHPPPLPLPLLLPRPSALSLCSPPYPPPSPSCPLSLLPSLSSSLALLPSLSAPLPILLPRPPALSLCSPPSPPPSPSCPLSLLPQLCVLLHATMEGRVSYQITATAPQSGLEAPATTVSAES